MTVLATGDSHVWCAEAGGAYGMHLGPITLNRLGRPGESEHLRDSWFVTWEGPVLLMAGEIDVRRHISAQIHEHGRKTDEVINTLADSGVSALAQIGGVVALAAVPPTVVWTHWDTRGTIQERVKWTRMLNAALLDRLGPKLVDPYAMFRDTLDGCLDPKVTDGEVHLNDRYGPEAFGPILYDMESWSRG